MSSYRRAYLTGQPPPFATSHITDRENNAAAGYQGPVKEGTHMVRTLRLLTSSIVNECFASTYVDLFLVLTATVLASELKNTFLIEGIMSPQAHARVDEQHFEIVGPTESSGSCFHLFEIAFIFRKLAEFFITNVL